MEKVKCAVCKEGKFVNPQALVKRIAKYGSIEQIELKWVCRECNPGKSKKVKVITSSPTVGELTDAEKRKTAQKVVNDSIRQSIPVSEPVEVASAILSEKTEEEVNEIEEASKDVILK